MTQRPPRSTDTGPADLSERTSPSTVGVGAPTIAVVIPAYRHAEEVPAAIESALEQSVRPTEVIVVDDCSPDGEQLREALASWIESGRVRLLKTSRNAGPAAARNVGIQASTSDLIALLDADDRFEPGHLEGAVEILAEHPDAAMTCADAYVERDGVRLPGLKNDPRGPIDDVITFERLLESNCINTLTVVLRRDAFDAFGPFDEAPELVGVEDYDLWLRVSKEREIRYVATPMCSYARSDGSISAAPGRLFEGENAVFDKLERVVDGFAATHGHVAARRRREMLFDYAYNLGARGDRRLARRAAFTAVARYPWSLQAYKLVARALVGRR